MQRESNSRRLAAVEFDERFLAFSWIWLNDPETKLLSQTPTFTQVEQLAWFHSLPDRSDYAAWGIEMNGVPIGAMGLKHIENESAECWMYIGDKSLWGRGIGSSMFLELFEFARLRGLKQVSGRIMECNPRSIRMCKSLGFVETGSDGAVLRMERDLRL